MIDAAIENLKTCQTQLDQDGVMIGVSRQALEELLAHVAAQPAPIAERERNPLNQLPNDLYWLIGKGKTRPDEPLYGVQLLEPGSLKIIAEAEHDDLTEAIAAAIRARGQV